MSTLSAAAVTADRTKADHFLRSSGAKIHPRINSSPMKTPIYTAVTVYESKVSVRASVETIHGPRRTIRRQNKQVMAAHSVSSHSDVCVGQLPNCWMTKVAGMKVMKVTTSGTYTPSPMMGGDTTPRPDFVLLGAIVEGADANWFFKCTGPRKTMESRRKEFDALIESIHGH